MEDKKLLRLLHKDPNAGMKQLLKQYAGLVYAVVKGRLKGSYCVSSDIEDCVADVFSKFYTDLSGYDPALSSIKSYLGVMARNHAANVAKRRNLEASISLDDEAFFLQIADETVADESAEEELRGKVIEAVEGLGEPDSSIIFRKKLSALIRSWGSKCNLLLSGDFLDSKRRSHRGSDFNSASSLRRSSSLNATLYKTRFLLSEYA